MLRKFLYFSKLDGAEYILALKSLTRDDQVGYVNSLTLKQLNRHNRIVIQTRPAGPDFPLQFEKGNEIILMNWKPNEMGISGQLFYRKQDGKYGMRSLAENEKIEIIFDEEYPAPSKTENGNFSYSIAPMFKAEQMMPALGAQVAQLAKIELPSLELDAWEDKDGIESDWAQIHTTTDDEGLTLDIHYSNLREQFRVAVSSPSPDDIKLCKKFSAAHVPTFGMDVSDQTTAYNYAEALASILDKQREARLEP